MCATRRIYFDPATGQTLRPRYRQRSAGEYKSPRLPSPQDWVLVLENNEQK